MNNESIQDIITGSIHIILFTGIFCAALLSSSSIIDALVISIITYLVMIGALVIMIFIFLAAVMIDCMNTVIRYCPWEVYGYELTENINLLFKEQHT